MVIAEIFKMMDYVTNIPIPLVPEFARPRKLVQTAVLAAAKLIT